MRKILFWFFLTIRPNKIFLRWGLTSPRGMRRSKHPLIWTIYHSICPCLSWSEEAFWPYTKKKLHCSMHISANISNITQYMGPILYFNISPIQYKFSIEFLQKQSHSNPNSFTTSTILFHCCSKNLRRRIFLIAKIIAES